MSINAFTEYKFAIPITVVDAEGDDLQKLLDEIIPVSKKLRQGPLNNPWSSEILSTFDWDAPVKVNVIAEQLPTLKSHVLTHMHKVLTDLEVYPLYSFVDLDESWFNYSKKGMYQEFHMHPGADWSGVFYVEANDTSGNIQFTTPAPAHNFHDVTHRSPVIFPQVAYTPKAGRMVMFPSYLEHMVMANQNEEERISIAFNIKLVN